MNALRLGLALLTLAGPVAVFFALLRHHLAREDHRTERFFFALGTFAFGALLFLPAWRAEAWQRWLDLDPLHVVRKRADAFAPAQRIYLDGAEHDEFGANIGARKIHEVLRERKSPVTFYESPGHHNDRMAERLVRGVAWVMGK